MKQISTALENAENWWFRQHFTFGLVQTRTVISQPGGHEALLISWRHMDAYNDDKW